MTIRIHTLLVCTQTILLSSLTASIALLDWPDASDIEGTLSFQNMGSPETTTNRQTYRQLNLGGTPLLVAETGIYNGIDVYGAVEYFDSSNSFSESTYARTQNSPDVLQYGKQSVSGSDTGMKGLTAFAKADFASLSGSSMVSFDSNSQFDMIVNWENSDSLTLRFAVLDGSQWYLSETSASDTFSISDLASENFGAWNPGSSGILGAEPGAFSTSGSSISDIQGVGLYFDHTRAGNSGWLQIENISVTAVPEPSSYATIAGILSLVLLAMRKRFRKS